MVRLLMLVIIVRPITRGRHHGRLPFSIRILLFFLFSFLFLLSLLFFLDLLLPSLLLHPFSPPHITPRRPSPLFLFFVFFTNLYLLASSLLFSFPFFFPLRSSSFTSPPFALFFATPLPQPLSRLSALSSTLLSLSLFFITVHPVGP